MLALALATVPCLFWLWSVLRHDDNEREPWGYVVLAVVLGLLCPLAVLWARPLLEEWLHPDSLIVETFVVTALGEELWKVVFFLPLLFSPELDEPLDGGVYGAAVGLGFAAFENCFVLGGTGDARLAIQRVFTATLLHAACTGCIGIALAAAKVRGLCRVTVIYFVLAVAVPVLLHGLYDYYLSSDRSHAMISLLLVLPVTLMLLSVKLRWARRRSHHYHAPE